jgi:predicted ester cyclase
MSSEEHKRAKGKDMTAEANKEAMRRIIEDGYNHGNTDAVNDYVCDSMVDHTPQVGQKPGREGWKETIDMARSTFPDLHIELDTLIAEGEWVMFRGRICGTNTGEFNLPGLPRMPATGRKLEALNMALARFENGKMVERWLLRNERQIAQQMGLLPEA